MPITTARNLKFCTTIGWSDLLQPNLGKTRKTKVDSVSSQDFDVLPVDFVCHPGPQGLSTSFLATKGLREKQGWIGMRGAQLAFIRREDLINPRVAKTTQGVAYALHRAKIYTHTEDH